MYMKLVRQIKFPVNEPFRPDLIISFLYSKQGLSGALATKDYSSVVEEATAEINVVSCFSLIILYRYY